MRIATWNVNSLRVRLPQVLKWLEYSRADVLALQETKLQDHDFPVAEFRDAGYFSLFSGQKTYNGVAVLSRTKASEPATVLPGVETAQKRVLAATVDGVRLVNLYVVNGAEVGSDKYRFKLDWLEGAARLIQDELSRHERVAVVGDFNIAPGDADVHDPALWRGRILCSTPEREALQRILGHGLTDAFRLFKQPPATFSWWDYRGGAFRRNHGLRIDLVLVSAALARRCSGASVDQEPRAWERASDHAPVTADFDI